MEELQSTEVLEREILEDARKKALRILTQADNTIAEKKTEWDKKTAQSVAEIIKDYNSKKESYNEKVMSRLPIDKLRLKADKIEKLLKEAAQDWYKNTSRRRIIELLSIELSKRLNICKGMHLSSGIKAGFYGITRDDAETILNNSGIKAVLKEIKSTDPYPAITIETDNTRIIASIQNIIEFYLADKREELVGALVGRDFMERL